MTENIPPGLAAEMPGDFITAHQSVLADKAIQFQFSTAPDFEPPAWLKPLAEMIQMIAPYAKFAFWGGLALMLAGFLYFMLREFGYWRWPRSSPGMARPAEWLPDAAPARRWLAEADALAAAGQFGPAAHLLLLRSIEDIRLRQPSLLKPSSTAREISVTITMPETARHTFALIARHVEASLFAGLALDAGGWEKCRKAYGQFALPGEWR